MMGKDDYGDQPSEEQPLASEKEQAEALMADVLATQVPCMGPLPILATVGSAGADLKSLETLSINAGDRALVGTGVYLAIPPGYVGLVCPRSGLAIKYGLTVLNGPGIIDSDYRGEIKVPLVNLGQKGLTINIGDKIAQLVIIGCPRVMFVQAESLDNTERGSGGFGSTGT